MRFPVPHPDGSSVIEVENRASVCVVPGCGGHVVRHSLGAGQSVDRCTRCFRRYQVRGDAALAAAEKSRLRRMLDEFVAWRE